MNELATRYKTDYSLDRDDEYETLFDNFLTKEFRHLNGEYIEQYYQGFENDVFYLRSFYWGECSCGGDDDDMTSPELHNKECLIYKPNFIYKKNGFELHWYKYPLRGNSCNKEISTEYFRDILEHCIKSRRNTLQTSCKERGGEIK